MPLYLLIYSPAAPPSIFQYSTSHKGVIGFLSQGEHTPKKLSPFYTFTVETWKDMKS